MMDNSVARTFGLTAITAIMTVFVARAGDGATTGEAGGALAPDSTVHADSTVSVRWLSEANIFALVAGMNETQIAAANAELSAWRSDTVRAIASGLLHDHTDLQHTSDSVAASLHIVRLPSALNDVVLVDFQAQVDSVNGNHGAALDRVYIRQAINGHRLMESYLDQLDQFASSPGTRTWLESASARIASQLARLTAQHQAFAVADSAAADSLAKRVARRNRSNHNQ